MALPRLRGAGIVAGLAQVQTRAVRLFPIGMAAASRGSWADEPFKFIDNFP
jgi:hypothetical protein